MSAFAMICNALTLVFISGSLLFTSTANYYNRQSGRILSGLPEQPKPWYVRLADPMLGGRNR